MITLAKYEKRNVKKIKPEKPQKMSAKPAVPTESIEMKPVKSVKLPKKKAETKKDKPKRNVPAKKEKNDRLTVVKGYKSVNAGKTAVSVIAVLLIVGLVIAAATLPPTGVPEFFTNTVAVLEKGDGFPQTLSGEDVLFSETVDKVTYVLSKTYLETYNSTGANLINHQHGFSNAALKTSAARALVFDRGGTGCKIYNFSDCLFEENFEDRIMAADIARDGSVAFALNSAEYASRVEVYNKDFIRRYTWNAANETVSAVALSEDGSRLAVAAFNAVNGEYLSNLYIFDFKSATPLYSKQMPGEMIISFYSDSGSVWAVTQSGVSRVSWEDYSVKDSEYAAGVDVVTHSDKMLALVTPSEENSLESRVELFDKDGSSVLKLSVTGEADGICIGKEYIYILINDSVLAYDFEGTLVTQAEVGYGTKFITEINSGSFASVSARSITVYGVGK